MAKEKKCKYCTIYEEMPDFLFLGYKEHSLKGTNIDGDKEISSEIVMDVEMKRLQAITTIFGTYIHSNKIAISYCPFCGRKL